MKYDHMVKVNGKYYPAGSEVPVCNDKKVTQSEDITAEKPKRGRPTSK